MSANSLLTVTLFNPYLQQQLAQIAADGRALEEQLAAFYAEHPGVTRDDIRLEVRQLWGPYRYTVRLKTADEKWLEWQSSNHGWERSAC